MLFSLPALAALFVSFAMANPVPIGMGIQERKGLQGRQESGEWSSGDEVGERLMSTDDFASPYVDSISFICPHALWTFYT
jgi:hypothetical protein